MKHGEELMAVSRVRMKMMMRDARTKDDVVAIMRFIRIQMKGANMG